MRARRAPVEKWISALWNWIISRLLYGILYWIHTLISDCFQIHEYPDWSENLVPPEIFGRIAINNVDEYVSRPAKLEFLLWFIWICFCRSCSLLTFLWQQYSIGIEGIANKEFGRAIPEGHLVSLDMTVLFAYHLHNSQLYVLFSTSYRLARLWLGKSASHALASTPQDNFLRCGPIPSSATVIEFQTPCLPPLNLYLSNLVWKFPARNM